MRHRNAGRRLGVKVSHKQAMLKNLLTSLLISERITTTIARAKELQGLADKTITLGKKGTLACRRLALKSITRPDIVRKLFTEIAPRYADVKGGYTRILRIGYRKGDNAEMAIIELTKRAEKPKKDETKKGETPKEEKK